MNLCFLSAVDGTCYGLGSGDIKIEIVVDECEGFENSNQWGTGWKAPKSVIVMEIHSISQNSSKQFHYSWQLIVICACI